LPYFYILFSLSFNASIFSIFLEVSIESFFFTSSLIVYHTSIGSKLSIHFVHILGSLFVFCLIKFKTKGINVIQLCLNKITISVKIKISIAGIAAT